MAPRTAGKPDFHVHWHHCCNAPKYIRVSGEWAPGRLRLGAVKSARGTAGSIAGPASTFGNTYE